MMAAFLSRGANSRPNVSLSCWRGFAASAHRADATGKGVPISFSEMLDSPAVG